MVSDEKKTVLEYFAAGRKFYKLMEFQDAHDSFEKALSVDPYDAPSKVYVERCKYYIRNPPPDDWDGVFTMVTK